MADVLDRVPCPQCGNAEADFEFCSFRETTWCSLCGYWERWDPQYDDDKCCGWKHEIRRGAGTLWYRFIGGIDFRSYCFNRQAQVRRAERWLRKQLAVKTVEADTAYLTRWIAKPKRSNLSSELFIARRKRRREREITCSLTGGVCPICPPAMI